MRRDGLAGTLVVLSCLLCYANAFEGSFHYDDFHSLVDNPGIRELANLPRFFVDPSLFSADADKAMYRPLLLVTYALNYALGGYRVWGYHLVNLGLHALCSLLVWTLGKQLLGREREGLFCGLLFAVHPLATEPVNYLSSRSESLVAVFYLATLLLHLKGEERPFFRPLAVVCFGLGLLAKSVAITAPVTLLLCDRWVRGQAFRLRVYAPYGVLAAGYLSLIWQNGFLPRSLAAPVRGFDAQLWTQAKAWVYYLKLLFVPWGLNVEPQFFASPGPAEAAVLAGLALLGSLAFLVWSGKRLRLLAFALAWGGIVLLPASAMPLNMLVNERRLYLPLAGLAWGSGWLLGQGQRPALYLWLLLLAGLTAERNPVWRDELTLWQDAARKSPHMYRAQTNLGRALQQTGDWQGAMEAYQRAIAIDPNHGDAYNNIATLYHLQGQLDEAITWYHRALERYPNYEEIYQNLADAHAQKGELELAIASYQRAVELEDRNGGIWNNYGQTLYQAGRWDQAERAFLKAIERLPGQAEPYNNLGNLYSRQGEFERAVAMYQQALARNPEAAGQVLVNLGDTYLKMGEVEKAREAIRRAIDREPGLALAYFQLGRIERVAGRPAAAEAAFQRAVELDSAQVKARVEWAEVLADRGEWRQAIPLFRAVLDRDPKSSRAWYGLAESLDRVGERSAARQAYARFLETWPHPDARFQQAQARLRQLQREE